MNLLDTLAGTRDVAVTDKPIASTAPAPVQFVPYNACLDPQADAFLPWMWKRMQEDDLVDYYFPGQRDTGFATFVRLMSGDAQVALVTMPSETKQWDDTVIGFVSWTMSRFGTADVIVGGFVIFRKFWDHHTALEGSKRAFEFWFTQTSASVVLGVCPSLHRVAIRHDQRMGMKEIGRIPQAHIFKGQPCDAILFAITRDEWEARCQQQQ